MSERRRRCGAQVLREPPLTVRRRVARAAGRTWARLHYAQHVEPHLLSISRLRLPIRNLPSSFDGLRIVHLSDWHLHDDESIHRVQESIELANALEPDLVAITGDFIHDGHSKIETAGRLAAHIRASYGVVAVFGNHDWAVRSYWLRRYHASQPRRRRLRQSLRSALESYGVRVLQNEHFLLDRSRDVVAVVGLEDLWSHRCDVEAALKNLPPEIPRIILAHNPMTIEKLKSYRCDLLLAGHTHGGQIKLLQNRLLAFGRAVRHYRAGLYRANEGWLYVTTGVGCGSFRMRYGVPPEIAVITVYPGDPDRDPYVIHR